MKKVSGIRLTKALLNAVESINATTIYEVSSFVPFSMMDAETLEQMKQSEKATNEEAEKAEQQRQKYLVSGEEAKVLEAKSKVSAKFHKQRQKAMMVEEERGERATTSAEGEGTEATIGATKTEET